MSQRIPLEQFDALSKAIDEATATGVFPKCPICNKGMASRRRMNPRTWEIICTCGHTVEVDPNE